MVPMKLCWFRPAVGLSAQCINVKYEQIMSKSLEPSVQQVRGTGNQNRQASPGSRWGWGKGCPVVDAGL